LFHWNFSVT